MLIFRALESDAHDKRAQKVSPANNSLSFVDFSKFTRFAGKKFEEPRPKAQGAVRFDNNIESQTHVALTTLASLINVQSLITVQCSVTNFPKRISVKVGKILY